MLAHDELWRREDLHEETRHGLAVVAIGGVAEEDGSIVGSVEQPEEVVGIDLCALAASGHMIVLAQVEGDEAVVGLRFGEGTFLHIENEQVVEVEQSRLEHTDDLDVSDRVTMERQKHHFQVSPQDITQRHESDATQSTIVDEGTETVQHYLCLVV